FAKFKFAKFISPGIGGVPRVPPRILPAGAFAPGAARFPAGLRSSSPTLNFGVASARRNVMLRPRPAKTRVRKSVSAALTFLLVLAFLPAVSHAPGAAARAAGDDTQNPNVPVIAPGSAYRQTNFISDIPGLAPVLDPLLVNCWGITVRGTSPFWIVNNGTSTTQLVRGDVGGAPVTLNPSPQTITLPGGLPTGAVGNSTSDFQIAPPGGGTPAASLFIFDSITGNILAWNAAQGSTAKNVVSNPGHVYTGLAIGS